MLGRGFSVESGRWDSNCVTMGEKILPVLILSLQNLWDSNFLNYRNYCVVYLDLFIFFNNYLENKNMNLSSVVTKSHILFSLHHSMFSECEISDTDN